jgi:hypothetical protein
MTRLLPVRLPKGIPATFSFLSLLAATTGGLTRANLQPPPAQLIIPATNFIACNLY